MEELCVCVCVCVCCVERSWCLKNKYRRSVEVYLIQGFTQD